MRERGYMHISHLPAHQSLFVQACVFLLLILIIKDEDFHTNPRPRPTFAFAAKNADAQATPYAKFCGKGVTPPPNTPYICFHSYDGPVSLPDASPAGYISEIGFADNKHIGTYLSPLPPSSLSGKKAVAEFSLLAMSISISAGGQTLW